MGGRGGTLARAGSQQPSGAWAPISVSKAWVMTEVRVTGALVGANAEAEAAMARARTMARNMLVVY